MASSVGFLLLCHFIFVAAQLLTTCAQSIEDRVVFVTGGAGSICSVQTKALVYLGANACIVGRNTEKTERAAVEIASVRPGAKVIGIGAVDVRSVRCSSKTRETSAC